MITIGGRTGRRAAGGGLDGGRPDGGWRRSGMTVSGREWMGWLSAVGGAGTLGGAAL